MVNSAKLAELERWLQPTAAVLLLAANIVAAYSRLVILQALLFISLLAMIPLLYNSWKGASRKRREYVQAEACWEWFCSNSDTMVWAYDLVEQRLTYISTACEKLYGYSADDFLQEPRLWLEGVHAEAAAAVDWQAIEADKPESLLCERLIHHANGEERWVQYRTYPEFNAAGKLIGLKGTATDMTERKAEEELRLKDLHLATLVQKSVLSEPIRAESFSIDARYMPADHLGGDLYIWYQLDPDRYGIMIMDVMGSGVTSSLISMSIRSLLEGIIRKCKDPEIVVQELNSHMCKLFRQTNSPAYFFFTACYAVVDTANKRIEYVNAGHTSAYLADALGDVKELSSTSIPIGLQPGLQPVKHTLHYEGPARLVMYTDGLIEAPGTSLRAKQAELIASIRNGAVLPLSEFMDLLLRISHEERRQHPDDVCLVCADLK